MDSHCYDQSRSHHQVQVHWGPTLSATPVTPKPYSRTQAHIPAEKAFREPTEYCEPYFVRAASILSTSMHKAGQTASTMTPEESISHTTFRRHPRHRGQRLLSVNFARKTMQSFRKDPEWNGSKYDLLTRTAITSQMQRVGSSLAMISLRRLTGALCWVGMCCGLCPSRYWTSIPACR